MIDARGSLRKFKERAGDGGQQARDSTKDCNGKIRCMATKDWKRRRSWSEKDIQPISSFQNKSCAPQRLKLKTATP